MGMRQYMGTGRKTIEGASMLDFAIAYKLVIVKSYFKKKEEHLVIFRSGIARMQIDYLLMRASHV